MKQQPLVLALMLLGACGVPTGSETVAPPTVLVLSPNSGTLFIGQSLALQAVTAESNNTTQQVPTTQIAWSSSNTASLTVSSDGVVTGVTAGTGVVVTAKWSGLSATASFNVTGATLASLALEPNPLRLAIGQTVSLSLQGTLSDGSMVDLTQSAEGTTYACSDTTIATVSVNGAVTAAAVGAATVTATSAGKTATAAVSVTSEAVTLTSLAVTPSWQSMTVGAAGAVTLTANFSDGSTTNVTSDPSTTWTSSDPTLLTVAVGGVLTALASGNDVAVIAGYGGLRATASVDIVGSTLVSLALQPDQLSLAINGAATLSVLGTYTDGHSASLNGATGLMWSSGAPSIVSVAGPLVTGLTAGGPVTVQAQLGALSASCSVTVAAVSVVSLSVTPASGTVPLRGGLQLTVTGQMSDGSTRDLSSASSGTTYTSGSPRALTVDPDGLVLGWEVSGPITVTASNSGQTATAQLTVTAASGQVVTLAVTPSTSRISLQQTLALQVVATYGSGETANVTTSAGTVYSSSNPAVASVDSNGVVTGLSAGSVTITAANQSASATAAVGVGPPPATLTGLTVTPTTIQGDPGTTSQLSVTGQFSDGSSQNLTAATAGTLYSVSGNPAVASVGSGGLVTLATAGNCVILIQNGSAQATVTVTVNARTLTLLEVSPNTLQVPVGFIAQLTVTGLFSDGSTANLTSSSTGTEYSAQSGFGRFDQDASVSVSVSADGLVTALSEGRANINIASGGLTASLRVSVVNGSVSQVSASAAAGSIPVGLTTQLTCNAALTGGQIVNVTSSSDGTEWVSGNAGVVSVSTDGLATGISAGTATVTCLNNGESATVAVTVTPAIAEQITVTPTAASLPVGVPLALVVTVQFSDGTTQDVSAASNGTTYIPSNLSAVEISADGVVTGLTAGATATITVLVAGKTATVTVQVTPPIVESISLSPSVVSVAEGGMATLTVTGVFSDGSTMPLTAACGLVFSVADSSTATIDATGDVTGVGTGVTTVEAFVAGLSATATVIVAGAD